MGRGPQEEDIGIECALPMKPPREDNARPVHINVNDAVAQLLYMQTGVNRSTLSGGGSNNRKDHFSHSRSSSMGNVQMESNMMMATNTANAEFPLSTMKPATTLAGNLQQHHVISQEQQQPSPHRCVENMPYMDEYQAMGLYSGETNKYGVPNGWGEIRYNNGRFFKGRWNNGIPTMS